MTPAQCRTLRARLGLTQAELGQLVGVTRTSVSRWEMDSARYPIQAPVSKLLRYYLADVLAQEREAGLSEESPKRIE